MKLVRIDQALLTLVFCCVQGQGLAASVDATARALGGIAPVADSAVFQGKDFEVYSKSVSQYWARYQEAVLTPLSDWSAKNLPQITDDTVFYPFSGPDLPTAYALEPGANRYILVAIQHAEGPPDAAAVQPAQAKEFLANLRLVWARFAQTGFFRTTDLDHNAARPGLRISPTVTLMAFASRLGLEIESIQPIRVSANPGEVVVDASADADWRSVRLTARRGARLVLIDYLCIDLSDANLRRNSAEWSFIEHAARSPTILKAASHLPQEPGFSMIRDAILEGAPFVFQDETGIDYAMLSRNFSVHLYGQFSRPHRLFSTRLQQSLANAYAKDGSAEPLTFRVGYLKAAGSAIQVAVRASAVPDPLASSGSQPDQDPAPGPARLAELSTLEAEVERDTQRYLRREHPVFLSVTDPTPAYSDYLKRTHSRLAAQLVTLRPFLSIHRPMLITVFIGPDGLVRRAELERGCGDSRTDARALALLEGVGKIAALPEDIRKRGDVLALVISFPTSSNPGSGPIGG
jgi:hypothetical protein